MIWIVSKSIIRSKGELDNRLLFIKDLTQTQVSPWKISFCGQSRPFTPKTEFYQCISKKGEYGIIITAHIYEVQVILKEVLSKKKALVAVNSCAIYQESRNDIQSVVKEKNKQSELFFAKQEKIIESRGIFELNYVENVGTFEFATTRSERELFQQRKHGLTSAIRFAFEKVM